MTHPKLARFKSYDKTIKFLKKYNTREKKKLWLMKLPDEAMIPLQHYLSANFAWLVFMDDEDYWVLFELTGEEVKERNLVKKI